MSKALKIKIDDAHDDEITAVLDGVQRRCRERLIYSYELDDLVKTAEAALAAIGIPVGLRQGARYEFAEGGIQGVCNAYKKKAGPRDSTHVVIQRGSKDWFLISASRRGFFPGAPGRDNLVLTTAQKDLAIQRFASGLRVYEQQACAA
jgi:hypothetical protein